MTEDKRRSWLTGLLVRLVKEKPLGAVGLVITLLLLFTGIFADYLAPYGMNDMHTDDRLAPPSARFLLGTDNLGRDLLSRVIFGARVSMVVGVASSAVATVISVAIGMMSGYIGGKFDLIVQRFVDAVMSLPMIIIVAVIISMVGQGILPLIIVMGVGGGISGSRHSRGFTISVVGNAYVQAAAAIGAPTSRILLHHILPNIAPLIIVGFSVLLPGIILTEASLSFLGYGIPPPAPSWGAMLSGANRSYMFLAPVDGAVAGTCPERGSVRDPHVRRRPARHPGPAPARRCRALRGRAQTACARPGPGWPVSEPAGAGGRSPRRPARLERRCGMIC